ncbi:MAG: hypothetical protein JJU28_16140 [Cyclobacteriaceae bacterium]|nr:hypothetical protein [Cyclobacteriaceae bacterium]
MRTGNRSFSSTTAALFGICNPEPQIMWICNPLEETNASGICVNGYLPQALKIIRMSTEYAFYELNYSISNPLT